MPFCIYCGAEVAEDARFCMKCGGPRLKPGETLEPIVIDAPEGATVTISDAPPEIKNAKVTGEQVRQAAKKVKKVITKITEAKDSPGEMILTDWSDDSDA